MNRTVSPLTVCAWELRRIKANRSSLGLAIALAAFFTALVAFKHEWAMPVNDAQHVVITVYGSTALGRVDEVVVLLLVFFGLVVPFLTADAVARDQKQRVHELMMTTSVGTAAYVWGRFAAALLTTLLAAVVMALAAAWTDVAIHAGNAAYPEPQLWPLVVSWLLLVVPAVVFVGGLCFAIATLLPRLSMTVKLGAVLTWIGLVLAVDVGHGLGWLAYWTPTSEGILKVLPGELAQRYLASAAGLDPAGQQQLALTIQREMPDLGPWIGPHIGLTLFGFLAVALAAVAFRRFRDDLN